MSRLAEGFVDTPGNPGILHVSVLSNHHCVHDREDTGPLVVVLLDFFVAGE